VEGSTRWESRDAHLQNFRGTDRCNKYAALPGEFLAAPPLVEHFVNYDEQPAV
jgi:hypothetical protein